MSYAERAKLIGAVADVLVANRARYEAIAIANSGNTKSDAAIDIDGGIGTLKYYARLGQNLGDARMLLDEKPVRLAKAENYQAIHLLVPRRGVAVHINAFNFPSWGLWEKAAVSLLAGVPVLAKPASATAMLAHAMVRDVIAAKVLPDGALSLLCGGAGDLLAHLTVRRCDRLHRFGRHGGARARPSQCGGEERAGEHRGRQHQCGAACARRGRRRRGVRRLRARSGARDDGEGRAEMHRDPPHLRAGRAAPTRSTEALAAKLKGTKIGDPRQRRRAHGPVVTRAQQAAAFDGIRRLADEATIVCGGAERARARRHRSRQVGVRRADAAAGQGCRRAQAVHEVEVFGPAATIVPLSRRDTRPAR